jgi:biopolymer transport protein ExbB/TolQ
MDFFHQRDIFKKIYWVLLVLLGLIFYFIFYLGTFQQAQAAREGSYFLV